MGDCWYKAINVPIQRPVPLYSEAKFVLQPPKTFQIGGTGAAIDQEPWS